MLLVLAFVVTCSSFVTKEEHAFNVEGFSKRFFANSPVATDVNTSLAVAPVAGVAVAKFLSEQLAKMLGSILCTILASQVHARLRSVSAGSECRALKVLWRE